MTTDLANLDATAQAELVANGSVSAVELVDSAIAAIEALNPAINAVIFENFDRARAAAADLETGSGPFAGVPFLIKDIGATQAGLPNWLGNQALNRQNHQSKGDTVLGARFRAAGLITLGKTNLPELGSTPTTQPVSCGPTNNPWDLTRSPAGSSGGSAAAVASGMVAIAHANDGGGSTRLPAAWCGLVGLKTTRGRVPYPDNISRLVSELVVTRSVRDTARLLDAVHGATPADLFVAAPPRRPYAEELGREVGPLKVAMMTGGGRYQVDQACVDAADSAARVLESMGHHVEPVSDEVVLGGDSSVNAQLWMAALTRRVQGLGELAGRPLTEDEVEPYNWTAAERGRSVSAADWAAASEAQQEWARSVIEWLEPYDILVTPTTGCPPLTTEELEPPDVEPWKIGRTYGRIGVFTLPFNVTGNPAISLPLYQTALGLPIGVQFVAGMGREDLLLRLAAQLEVAVRLLRREETMRLEQVATVVRQRVVLRLRLLHVRPHLVGADELVLAELDAVLGQVEMPRAVACELEGQHRILECGQHGQQLEELKDDAYVLAAPCRQPFLGHLIDAFAADRYRPCGGPIDAGEDVEDRRFAASGRSDDGDQFAAVDRDIDSSQRGEFEPAGAVHLLHVIELD